MSVIGRLDEQVHDVLISPVSKRRRGGDEREPPPEAVPTPKEAPRERSEDENRPRREELPVWLL